MSAADSLQAQRVDIEAPSPPSARRESDQAQSHQAREPASFTQSLVAKIKAWLADPSHESLAQRVAGTAFLIRIASAVLAYVSQIALARWMGTYEFGVFVYVWTWTLLIGGFADAGLAAAAQKFVPEYAGRESFAHLRGFIVASRWLAAGIATALALIAVVVVKVSEPLLDTSAVIPLYIACLCLPIYALCSVQDGIARCYNSIAVGLMPTFIVRPILLLALMAGAHYSGIGSDATVAIICSVASFWLIGMVQTLLLQRSLTATVPKGDREYELRSWLSMSLPIVMVIGFYVLLTYVDIIILQKFRPPEDVAFYHAATKTLTLVTFVYFSVSAATAHRFSEYQTAGDHARLQEFIAKSVRWTFWPSVAVAAVVLAAGQLLLLLFGPDFVVAYPLMFILAIGLLARASIGPCERLLIMVGQQRACAAAYGGAFVVNLILCLMLIPYFGGAGAAASTALALIAESIMLYYVVKKRVGVRSFVFLPVTHVEVADQAVEAVSIVPPQADVELEVEWRKPDEMHTVATRWRDLCSRAIEPNIFLDPDFALNAAPLFGKNVIFGLVWSCSERPRRLVGLIAVRNVIRSGVTPILVGFTHPFSGLSMPLVDRDLAVPVIAALLDHIAANPQLPKTMVIPFVGEEGPFAAAFNTVLGQRKANLAIFDRHQRATFAPGEREGYFNRTLSSKKRKELRRQRNRLEDGGPLAFSLSTPEETPAALQDFMTLEASGWKGVRGTAVKCDPGTRKFFEDMVAGLAERGQATIARLTQGGRPIAAGIVVRSGNGAWFLKVAYDETQSQYSPGVQLTLDLTEALSRDKNIAFIDSCAVQDHPMIDHYWRERRQCADWLIGLDPRRPFALDRKVEHGRREFRKLLKWVYYKIGETRAWLKGRF